MVLWRLLVWTSDVQHPTAFSHTPPEQLGTQVGTSKVRSVGNCLIGSKITMALVT